jgi:hypothetical protein
VKTARVSAQSSNQSMCRVIPSAKRR